MRTREIRGEITQETAAALMADLDASEARGAAKSREDRQQIMLEAAIQARDETARQVAGSRPNKNRRPSRLMLGSLRRSIANTRGM